jgi:isopenicillin N synthase-like dioxygenase
LDANTRIFSDNQVKVPSVNLTMAPSAPPILDFSPFYGTDTAAKAKLVQQVRDSCEYNGFFQITGHRIPLELQRRVMTCAKRFFDLPLEEKLAIDKSMRALPRRT